jgi:hypothetical protein
MKAVISILKKHPISILLYIAYIYIIVPEYLSDRQYELVLIQNHGVRNGGLREWAGVLPILVTAIFLAVSILNLAIWKEQRKFYVWLILAIIAPYLLMANYFILVLVPFVIIILRKQ